MKVLWIQDNSPWTSFGGAEATDKQCILRGIREEGHEIQVMIPENMSTDLIDNAELIVISNAVRFPQQILEYALLKPFVVFLHDFIFCRFRAHYPRLEKCQACPYLPFWRRMFDESLLNLFLSPLHRSLYFEVMPELENHPSELICPPVDTSLFKPQQGVPRRENHAIYAGVIADYKGIREIIEYGKQHRELTIDFVGPVGHPLLHGSELAQQIVANGFKHLPPVAYNQMPQLLSSYQYAIELPPFTMPCERFILEAYLCGCQILANQNVGFLSWKFKNRKEAKRETEKSTEKFWKSVEKYAS